MLYVGSKDFDQQKVSLFFLCPSARKKKWTVLLGFKIYVICLYNQRNMYNTYLYKIRTLTS